MMFLRAGFKYDLHPGANQQPQDRRRLADKADTNNATRTRGSNGTREKCSKHSMTGGRWCGACPHGPYETTRREDGEGQSGRGYGTIGVVGSCTTQITVMNMNHFFQYHCFWIDNDGHLGKVSK